MNMSPFASVCVRVVCVCMYISVCVCVYVCLGDCPHLWLNELRSLFVSSIRHAITRKENLEEY